MPRPPYSIASNRLSPEELVRWANSRFLGYEQAPRALPSGTRVLALTPVRARGRILGSYGPCRAPHLDHGSHAPLPHFHYLVRFRPGKEPVAVRSDHLAGRD